MGARQRTGTSGCQVSHVRSHPIEESRAQLEAGEAGRPEPENGLENCVATSRLDSVAG
jgi:hypothetical protein